MILDSAFEAKTPVTDLDNVEYVILDDDEAYLFLFLYAADKFNLEIEGEDA